MIEFLSVQDNSQLLVIISRTELSAYTIFGGNEESSLDALVRILTAKTQWMEQILYVLLHLLMIMD